MPLSAGPVKVAVAGFSLGILTFCVPLYMMAIDGKMEIVLKTMPVGGLSMLTGWVSLILV